MLHGMPRAPTHAARTLLALAGVGCLALAPACAPAEQPEFRVGFLNVMVEPMGSVSGIPARDGAQMAVAEINAAGGVEIDGVPHRLVLVEREIEIRADAAATGARALINVDSVHAIVGPQISTLAIAAAAVAEFAQVPLISPMASNPAVTAGRSMIFRLAFLDEYQGSALARFAYDSLGVRRAAALYDEANPYSRDIWALFRTTFESRGGRVVSEQTFHTDVASDYRAQLRRLLAGNPDAILLPNYAVYDSVQVRQARELGFRGRFLGSDSWDPVAMVRIPAADGSVVIANWDHRAGSDSTRAFVARYRSQFGRDPRTTAAATFDAFRILANAATRAGSLDGSALASAIGSTDGHAGAVATYRFRGSGDPIRGGAILELRNGSTVLRLLDSPDP
jgi:branched-chain amino acid transport system substrate-binding protein